MRSLGTVESIGASGRAWAGFRAADLASMFFEELLLANRSIQICSFAMGHKSPVMEKLFAILAEQLENRLMKISVIINDDRRGRTVTPYARERIRGSRRQISKPVLPAVLRAGCGKKP